MNIDTLPKSLSITELFALANSKCGQYGLPPVTMDDLKPMYDPELIANEEMAPTLILRNDHVMLWVDRWYMAIQFGKAAFTYLYLTHFHIDEERESYAELKECRDDPERLPDDIEAQFKDAEQDMEKRELGYWFRFNSDLPLKDRIAEWSKKNYIDKQVMPAKNDSGNTSKGVA